MRELLGKNKSTTRSENVSIKAVAGNVQLVPGTTSGTETQSGSNMESTSLGERILSVVGENANQDGEQEVVGVEKTGQDLEECNLEFPMIERQF